MGRGRGKKHQRRAAVSTAQPRARKASSAPADGHHRAVARWQGVPMCEESAQRLEAKQAQFLQQRCQQGGRGRYTHHNRNITQRSCSATRPRSHCSMTPYDHFPNLPPPGTAGTLEQQRVVEHLAQIVPLLSHSLLKSDLRPARAAKTADAASDRSARWADTTDTVSEVDAAAAAPASLQDGSEAVVLNVTLPPQQVGSSPQDRSVCVACSDASVSEAGSREYTLRYGPSSDTARLAEAAMHRC